jgi:hypothetical protein
MKKLKEKKGQLDIAVHQKAFIYLGAMIVSIIILVFVYQQIQPSLSNTAKARASLTAHTIAYYLATLSSVDEGVIEKYLNETYTIEIGRYSGWNIFWKNFKNVLLKKPIPLSNYYVKVTLYDNKGNKLAESEDVSFVGSIENCEKAGKCLETEKITFVRFRKASGKQISLECFKTIEESGFLVCKEPTTEELEIYVKQYANKYGVEEALVLAVISAESQMKHCKSSFSLQTSPANALGLMQVLPETAEGINKEYGLDLDIKKPEDNIHAGVLVLKENLNYYKNRNFPENQMKTLAVANYNCFGVRNAVNKFCSNDKSNCWEIIKKNLNDYCKAEETIPYVERVMRLYECFNACLQKGEFCYKFEICKNRWNA